MKAQQPQKMAPWMSVLIGAIIILTILAIGQWMKANGYYIQWQLLKLLMIGGIGAFVFKHRWLPLIKAKRNRQ